MRKYSFLAAVAVFVLASSCTTEEPAAPVIQDDGVKTVNFRITASASPYTDGETKVAYNDGDTKFSWEGDEVLTIAYGKTASRSAANLPKLSTVSDAPGTFEGSVTFADGFGPDDILGVVAHNSAATPSFYYNTSYTPNTRVNIPCNSYQTQEKNGVLNPRYAPFYAMVSGSDLTEQDGTYTVDNLQLRPAFAFIELNIYGTDGEGNKAPGMEPDEVLERVDLCNYTGNYLAASPKIGLNASGDPVFLFTDGGRHAGVALTEPVTILDKTKENGVKVFVQTFGRGASYSTAIHNILIKTNKAYYTTSGTFSKTYSRVAGDIHKWGINLAGSTFTRASVRYYVDGDETVSYALDELPASYSSLKAVVPENTRVPLTLESLQALRAEIDGQETAVDIDLSGVRYFATSDDNIFPVVFGNGTAANACKKIRSIKFPSNTTFIESRAFMNCSSLEAVDLTNIKSIRSQAFNASGLKKLEIPSSVYNIGGSTNSAGRVFQFCYQLDTVKFNAINNSSSSSAANAINMFAWWTGNSQGSSDAHINDTDGWVLIIGDNVNKINSNNFCIQNRLLKKIVFMTNTDMTGSATAFRQLTALAEVECHTATPPALNTSNNTWFHSGAPIQTGGSVPAANRKLIVPKGAGDTYKDTAPWTYLITTLGFNVVEQDFE